LDLDERRLLRVAKLVAWLARLLLPGARAARLGRARGLRAARELLDQGQRLLQLLLAALQRPELVALGAQHAQQLRDLDLLGQRHTAQLLDVALAPEIHVRTVRSRAGLSMPAVRKSELQRPIGDGSTTLGDRERRPTSSQPSMNRASSLEVMRTTAPS